jgi:hypothetical protein
MAYTHGAQEAAFHGYGLQFAASWLWSHDQAPKPSGKVLAYIVHIANVSPHVMMAACWSGANHEDARSLMGVLRGKGTSNRVSWAREIYVAECDAFFNALRDSVVNQIKDTGTLNYREAVQAGVNAVDRLHHSGLWKGPIDIPVLYNEQEVIPSLIELRR